MTTRSSNNNHQPCFSSTLVGRNNIEDLTHRRGINTEEKGTGVAVIRVRDYVFNSSCFALGQNEEKEELHQDNFKKRINSSYSLNRPSKE